MTSLVDADSVLSDCVTSQEVVVNIKLPRRSRRTGGRQRGVPAVPFRELRLRREIRYTDDQVPPKNSTSAIVNGADPPLVTSSRDADDVTDDRKCKLNDVDDALATRGDSVLLTADNLLGASDLSTLLADAEVEYDNRDSSRSVELVPVCDGAGRPASQRVDVSRSQSTRVVRLSSTSSSRLVYASPSLMQTVDIVRLALLDRVRGSCAEGVAVSCDAVETVTRRGDQSEPVVRNIVVDCLPPPHDDDDNDDDGDGGSRTLVAI